ncbi:MAG TPA: DUF6468 domain-containing protein [Alphaproteobacteria bacterium]|jgi:biopolymer transport protein ExbB/TolQ|nr:DUF6468 domain-containing protein [Alphaproteobacteria bacterium]
MTLLVVLDIVVAVLLTATIGFCMVLNRRLAALRRNEAELKQVLAKFNQAAEQAETGIARLKEAGSVTAAALRERIGEAKALRDDLAFVTERGDRIASELSRKLTGARPAQTGAAAPRPAPRASGGDARNLSGVERELLAALEQAR